MLRFQTIACLAFSLLLPGCSFIQANIQPSTTRPDIASGIPPSTMPCVTVPASNEPELATRTGIASKVANAFSVGDFKTLEKYYNLYRQRTSRTPSGRWNIQFFYAGFSHSNDKKDWRMFEARLQQWMKEYPQSPAPHIAYGQFLINRAWSFRGDGSASEVPREAWTPFNKNIELARTHLEQTKKLASADPQWYVTMFTVAKAQSWTQLEVKALFQEALSKEAYYPETYQTIFDNLTPKWGGSFKEAGDFARDVTTITSECEGQGMYTRIYWRALDTDFDFRNNPFENSDVNWEIMKMGFEDIVTRYPTAWNINNFARFACLARDKETTKRLINQIGDNPVLEAWTRKTAFLDCKAWANH